MKASEFLRRASAVAIVSLLASCATWNEMDRSERGTAVGATGGALVGAAVGGPIGAVAGAGVGGYVGHHQGFGEPARPTGRADAGDASLVRSVQQSLNARGYDAGPVDGQWGPHTESALRQFQQANGLPQTGNPDRSTLVALGLSR